MAGLIVVDASVLIAHLDGTDALHERATALLDGAAGQRLAASPITLAEVLVGPVRAGRAAAAEAALRTLAIEEVPLGAGAPSRLATLRAATNLKLPDCCVLLAAQDARGALRSFDERLSAVAAELGLV